MDRTRRGTIEMVVAMVISGSIGWFVVTSGRAVLELLFWRCALGAATLWVACLALGLLRPLPWKTVLIAAVGGAAIVGNWLLLFNSFAHSPISIATIVYNTQPFMLLALSAIVLREQFAPGKLAWLVVSFGGVVLISQAKPGRLPPGADYVLGIGLALGAAFLYAVAALVAKVLKSIAPHYIALIQMCVGSVLLLPVAWTSGVPGDAAGWATFATMGVLYTGVVYILLYGAFQKLPTTSVGALSFIYPLVAVAFDHALFGVRLGPAQWAGAAAVLLGAAGNHGLLKWPVRLGGSVRT